MDEDQLQLYWSVVAECKKNPSFIRDVISACTAGIEHRVQEAEQYGYDMEILASQMMFMAGQKRVAPSVKKRVNSLALDKLEKHYNKNLRLRWDSYLEFAKGDKEND